MHSTVIHSVLVYTSSSVATYTAGTHTYKVRVIVEYVSYIFNCWNLLVCTERQISSYMYTYSYLEEFYVEQERRGNTSRIKL